MYNKHEKNSFLYLYFHNRVWSVIFFSPQCSRLKIDEATLLLLPLFWNNIHQQSKVWKFVMMCASSEIITFQFRVTLQTYSDLVWHPAFLFAGGLVQPGPSFLSLPVQNDTNGTRMAPTLSKSRNETRVFSWTEFCGHLIGQNNLESINVQEHILCQNANCHVSSAVLH